MISFPDFSLWDHLYIWSMYENHIHSEHGCKGITLYSEVNWKSYCTHFLYCPGQLSWLDFTALYQPLRCVKLSLLLSWYEPKWRVYLFDLPRETHSYFIEPICETLHLKNYVYDCKIVKITSPVHGRKCPVTIISFKLFYEIVLKGPKGKGINTIFL